MGKRNEARTALAVIAAVAGTGYASGRELVLFFAQMGTAGWIGVCFAPVMFALLITVYCRCAARLGADSFTGLCRGLMGRRAAAVALWLYAMLLSLTAAVMLCGAGEIGALTLPVRFGWLWGAGMALLIALLLNLSRLRTMPWLGLGLLAAGVVFYGALAADPRPPRIWLQGAVQLTLEGSWPASILLALAYAAMNAALGVGIALRFGGGRPARAGMYCGAMLLALLAAANGAVRRGGNQLLGQAMPTVILSARWGLPGFWVCAAFGFLCAVTTLAAALGGLVDLHRSGFDGKIVLSAVAIAALAGIPGLRHVIGAGYPAVGWAFALLMLALACRADALLFRGNKG